MSTVPQKLAYSMHPAALVCTALSHRRANIAQHECLVKIGNVLQYASAVRSKTLYQASSDAQNMNMQLALHVRLELLYTGALGHNP